MSTTARPPAAITDSIELLIDEQIKSRNGYDNLLKSEKKGIIHSNGDTNSRKCYSLIVTKHNVAKRENNLNLKDYALQSTKEKAVSLLGGSYSVFCSFGKDLKRLTKTYRSHKIFSFCAAAVESSFKRVRSLLNCLAFRIKLLFPKLL